jgi:hypothetical protein
MSEAYLSWPVLFECLRSASNSFADFCFQRLYRVLLCSHSALRSERKIASDMQFLFHAPCIDVQFCYEVFCWKSDEGV